MKLHYYPDTDSLYVEFKSEPEILPSPMPVRHAFTGYLLSTYSATIRVNCSDSSAAVPRSVVNWRPST